MSPHFNTFNNSDSKDYVNTNVEKASNVSNPGRGCSGWRSRLTYNLSSRREGVGVSGFTLVELLVVVVILVVIAAIAIPLFLNQKFKAAEAAVVADAKKANDALNLALAQISSPVLTDIEYNGGKFICKPSTVCGLGSEGVPAPVGEGKSLGLVATASDWFLVVGDPSTGAYAAFNRLGQISDPEGLNNPTLDALITASVSIASAPAAPTLVSATGGDGTITVVFTAGDDRGSAIVNYQYSVNGGADWSAVSPAVTTSPLVITGLTNATTYTVAVRAVSADGPGEASNTAQATPQAPGTLDTTFNSNAAAAALNNNVLSVALQSDGKLVVGGGFTNTGRRYLARFNADGTLDTAFNSNAAAAALNNTVLSVALQSDGKIVAVGGLLTNTGYPRLARFNTDGTLDTTFNTNVAAAALNNTVRAFAVQPDGKIVAGGYFTNTGYPYLARFNTDGTLDTTFNSNAAAAALNGAVVSVAVQPDGKIVAGGSFTNLGNRLARFNTDGTLDTAFNSNAAAVALNNTVVSVALQPDGKIVVGGNFTNTGYPRLVRFNG